MKRVLKIFIVIICLGVFVFSGLQIYNILNSRKVAKNHYKSYDEFVVKNTQATEKQVENSKKEKKVECNIDVDFEKLVLKYPDAVGWIYFEGTGINYPVVQAKDNAYYLARFPDGTANSSGSIFADYRNASPEVDENYIIYGHNMKNDTMFGLLNEYKNQSFYNEHPYFYFLTPDKTYKVDVVAGCDVETNSQVYKIDFDDGELAGLMDYVAQKTAFVPKKSYKKGDRIITLSTCSNVSDESRYVIMGVVSE